MVRYQVLLSRGMVYTVRVPVPVPTRYRYRYQALVPGTMELRYHGTTVPWNSCNS